MGHPVNQTWQMQYVLKAENSKLLKGVLNNPLHTKYLLVNCAGIFPITQKELLACNQIKSCDQEPMSLQS